jgi:hypothetical protein
MHSTHVAVVLYNTLRIAGGWEGANTLRGPLEGVGPENRDFFGP